MFLSWEVGQMPSVGYLESEELATVTAFEMGTVQAHDWLAVLGGILTPHKRRKHQTFVINHPKTMSWTQYPLTRLFPLPPGTYRCLVRDHNNPFKLPSLHHILPPPRGCGLWRGSPWLLELHHDVGLGVPLLVILRPPHQLAP